MLCRHVSCYQQCAQAHRRRRRHRRRVHVLWNAKCDKISANLKACFKTDLAINTCFGN